MSRSVIRARRAAFGRQKGLCCYCSSPMWQSHAKAFAAEHGLTRRQAREHRATAEHLVARKDGGKVQDNIAAACLRCNQQRHAKPSAAPDAGRWREVVQAQIALGRWRHLAAPLGPTLSRPQPQ